MRYEWIGQRCGVVAVLALCVFGVLDLRVDVAHGEEPVLSGRQVQIFVQVCAQCHVEGPANTPVVGDSAAWAPRRARGADVMLERTVNGFGDMPPLGTCGYCTEDDLRRLVAFMAGLDQAPAPSEARP